MGTFETPAFVRYLAVAGGVGVITVALRECLDLLLPAIPWQYGWTILLSYAVGIVLSYTAQARFTFGGTGHRTSRHGLVRFTSLAVLSALLTGLTAYVLRYGLPLQHTLPTLAPALAFAAAALLVAPVSFVLGRQVVFVEGTGSTPTQRVEPSWLWPLLTGLVLCHAAAYSQIPLRFNADAVHDEAHFMHLARSLAGGEWLGAYNQMTLTKGPGFAIWLAFVHFTQTPISWAASFTYSGACVMAYFALRRLCPRPSPRLLLFTALLACPVALSGFLVLRELIYPALTLLVVACGLGFALRMHVLPTRIQPWIWAAMLGMSTALFALTREEYVWLTPLWIGIAVYAAWLYWQGHLSARLLSAAFGVAVLTALLPVLVVASLNRHHYGVFTLVELNSPPFASAYGAMARVRSAPLAQVPVPRGVWPQLAAASPAFSELLFHLQGNIGNNWVNITPNVKNIGMLMDANPALRTAFATFLQIPFSSGQSSSQFTHYYQHNPAARQRIDTLLGGPANAWRFFNVEGEIGGGWFVWALRDSAAAEGHHTNATEANRFYRQLADEINAACADQRLICRPQRDTLSPPLAWELGAPVINALWSVSGLVPQFTPFSTSAIVGMLGTPAQLQQAEAFLHDRLAVGPAILPPVEPVETLIALFKHSLPWVSAVAFVAWLFCIPCRQRHQPQAQHILWWIGLLLLTLVGARLLMVALIHVTSWPVIDLRYMSAAHPLLVFFDAIGLHLLAIRIRQAYLGGSTRPLPTSDKNAVSRKYR